MVSPYQTQLKAALLITTLVFGLFAASSSSAQGGLSGRAWVDSNLNGQVDEGEIGLAGVRITIEDEDGVVYETITTDDGNWMLGPINGQRAILAYDISKNAQISHYRPSMAGWQTVQTIELSNLPDSLDAGFFDPDAFCSANLGIAAVRYATGDPFSAMGPEGYRIGDQPAIIIFDYDQEGQEGNSDYQPPQTGASLDQTGSVWGLAWDSSNQQLYSSAFLKRHAGLGSMGLGGIYVTRFALGISTEPFVDLAAVGVDVGSLPERELPGTADIPSADGDVFAQIGKIGLGGLDISQDGKTIYTMNLFKRELVVLDTDSQTVSGQFPIPDLGCTNGEVRPFAVKVATSGGVFAGAVCSAEGAEGTAADLSAHILEFDGKEFTEVISFSLDQFNRGQITGSFETGEWRPWTDSWVPNEAYPVPMLSDIEFDDDGSIIATFMDRSGHMGGILQLHPFDLTDTNLYNRQAAGDIIRICRVEESYVLEGTADTCPHNQSEGNQGSEFYTGEYFSPQFETVLGGATFLPHSGEVAVSVSNPFDYLTSGVRWLDNATGDIRRGYQLSPGNHVLFNGANGIGDLELICRTPPAEVGSRVWRDLNENGIFDAVDQPLPNVKVELVDEASDQILVSVVSDSNGRVGFSSAVAGEGADSSFAYELDFEPGKSYLLRTYKDTGAIMGLEPTDLNGAVNPKFNSDGQATEDFIEINFQLDAAGVDLYHLDFGFKLKPQPKTVAVATDQLEPPSNVVSNPSTNIGGAQARKIFGFPIDLQNKMFLAFSGLVTAGLCSLFLGLAGLITTSVIYRRQNNPPDTSPAPAEAPSEAEEDTHEPEAN